MLPDFVLLFFFTLLFLELLNNRKRHRDFNFCFSKTILQCKDCQGICSLGLRFMEKALQSLWTLILA